MKKNIGLILLLIIPIALFIVIGTAIMPKEIILDNIQVENGEITDFFEGANTRRIHKPMYIIINNDKYFIPSAIKWGVDKDKLLEVFAIGNEIEVEYIVNDERKIVVSIKENGEYLITKEEVCDNQFELQDINSKVLLFGGYLFFLYILMQLIFLFKKFKFDFNLGFTNKIYLSKLQIIVNVLISICLFVGSLLIIAVNEWLYFPVITLAMVYVFWSIISTNRLFYGTGGFRIIKYYKMKHYGWNAVKQIVKIKKRFRTIIIVNFKDSYDLANVSVLNYILAAKSNNNKYYFIISLNKKQIVEFDKLYEKYRKDKKVKV